VAKRCARRSFGHVLDDEDGRVVFVRGDDRDDAERPPRPERDRVPTCQFGTAVQNEGGSAGIPSVRSRLKVDVIRSSATGRLDERTRFEKFLSYGGSPRRLEQRAFTELTRSRSPFVRQ
jgi:hypothetical protein